VGGLSGKVGCGCWWCLFWLRGRGAWLFRYGMVSLTLMAVPTVPMAYVSRCVLVNGEFLLLYLG